MERTFITWNITNWATIGLMTLGLYAGFVLLSQAFQNWRGGA